MQNHLMQVLSIVAMEPPVKVAGQNYSNYVRDEKVKVLRCVRPIDPNDVVIGQYTRSEDGQTPGYLEDETVPAGSTTETFATIVMYIDNPRWFGVPFIMKAGKALEQRKVEVRVQLRSQAAAGAMFGIDTHGTDLPRNELVMRIQPSEAIYFKTNVKKPGLETIPVQSEMDLSFGNRYPNAEAYDAYSRLVLDVLRGKQATFVRDDELIAAWEIITPILEHIKNIAPIPYSFGSRGPKESDELISRAGYIHNAEYSREWVGRHKPPANL